MSFNCSRLSLMSTETFSLLKASDLQDGDEDSLMPQPVRRNSSASRMSFLGSITMDTSNLLADLDDDFLTSNGEMASLSSLGHLRSSFRDQQSSTSSSSRLKKYEPSLTECKDLTEVPEDSEFDDEALDMMDMMAASFQNSVSISGVTNPKDFMASGSITTAASSSLRSSKGGSTVTSSGLGFDVSELQKNMFHSSQEKSNSPRSVIDDPIVADSAQCQSSPSKPMGVSDIRETKHTANVATTPRPPDVVLDSAVEKFDVQAYHREQMLLRQKREEKLAQQQNEGNGFSQQPLVAMPQHLTQVAVNMTNNKIAACQERLNEMMHRTQTSRSACQKHAKSKMPPTCG